MRLGISRWLTGLLVLVGAGAASFWAFRPPMTAPAAFSAPVATPPGITLRPERGGSRANGTGAAATIILFADESGAPLYSFDAGSEPGTPSCAGDCAKDWRPALAPPSSAASGPWSVVGLPDRTWQWAFQTHPLYTRRPDAPALARDGGAAAAGHEPGAWHEIVFAPPPAAQLPVGIGSRDLPNGGGQAVTDESGMTLYAFEEPSGKPGCADPACVRHWKPAAAPEIAGRIGDFSVVARGDGVRQWAYKDRPLYRFDGDLQPDDANGAGFDPRFSVALALRYFMPGTVSVRLAPALGDILTTRDGMTLYARDRFIDADGHNFRTDHGAEAVGRALATLSCDVECAKTWHPLTVEAGALPSGYWDIFIRPDGSRQWAYKGYALYSYAGDHKPGDVNGNESYALAPLGQNDPYAAVIASATPVSRPGLGVGAMFWRAAIP